MECTIYKDPEIPLVKVDLMLLAQEDYIKTNDKTSGPLVAIEPLSAPPLFASALMAKLFNRKPPLVSRNSCTRWVPGSC